MISIETKIKAALIKYRSTLVMGVFLLLNVVESAYYGSPFLTTNERAQSIGELCWDNICSLGMFFAGFMAIYDLIQANAQFQYTVKVATTEKGKVKDE